MDTNAVHEMIERFRPLSGDDPEMIAHVLCNQDDDLWMEIVRYVRRREGMSLAEYDA